MKGKDVSPNTWQNTFGVDLSMFFTGFDMGVSLPSGGPTSSGNEDPKAGDINPYKSIDVGGSGAVTDKFFGFGGVIDGVNPIAGSGFNIDNVRGVALKAPTMLAGWGYDIDGNETFANPSGQLDYRTVKVGPIDWRWDDNRKVWVTGNTVASQVLWLSYDPPPIT